MDTNTENSVNSIPRNFQVIIMNTGFIYGGATFKLQDCDTSTRAISNDTHISEKSHTIIADTQFVQLKAKQHSAVMVSAVDDLYWLA